MKYTFIAGIVLLGFSFQAQAEGKAMNRACRILLATDSPKFIAPSEKIRSELQPFVENRLAELGYFYSRASGAQLKIDLNWAISHIAETNNRILDAGAYLRSEKFRFSNRAEKETYEKLMGSLKSLLQKQGMSPESIETAFEKRFLVVEELKKQNAQPITKRPIGFILPAADKGSERPVKGRTIGFMRNPIESSSYGNTSEISSEKEKGMVNKPTIGFIKTEVDGEEVPSRRLPSIGFIQPEAVVDVSYQLSLGFNSSTAQFETKSEQNQIGFVTEK